MNPVNITKIEGLITLLDYKPEVIGVTETWGQPNSIGQYKAYQDIRLCLMEQ